MVFKSILAMVVVLFSNGCKENETKKVPINNGPQGAQSGDANNGNGFAPRDGEQGAAAPSARQRGEVHVRDG